MQHSRPDPWTYIHSLPTDEPPDDLLFRIFAERRRRQRWQLRLRALSIAASLVLVAGMAWFIPPMLAGDGNSAPALVEGSRAVPDGAPSSRGASAVERAIEDAHRNGASAEDIARLQEIQRQLAASTDGADRPVITLI